MPELQFPPYALIILLSALINLGLGAYGIYNRQEKAMLYFGIALILSGLWSSIYFAQLIIADFDIIKRISYVMPVPIHFFPVFFLISIFLITKQKMPPSLLTASLFLLATVIVVLTLSGDPQIQSWGKILTLTTKEGFKIIIRTPGIWIKILITVLNYTAFMIAIYLLVKGVYTHKQPYKTQFILIIISLIAYMGITTLYIYNLMDFGVFNPIPSFSLITSSIFALAIFKYGFITIVPYARETVFDIINSPVIIVDSNNKFVDFNTQARIIFRFNSSMIGKNIEDIFHMINLNWSKLKTDESVILETRWGTGSKYRFSSLKKEINKDSLKGYIVIFNDITEQFDAMRTMHEKEILTYKETILGDMHDGIGGVVATGAIIAQTAIEIEDYEEKNNMIMQISNLLENGSFELRSMLNILDKERIDWRSLIADMRGFSSTVLDAKMISRKFNVHGETYASKIDFNKYISIFRLFKEVITNIIKHSQAENVFIDIYFTEDQFKLIINDDGIGIEPNQSKGFGLKNMKKRIENLNGAIDISSENGTTVTINIPSLND